MKKVSLTLLFLLSSSVMADDPNAISTDEILVGENEQPSVKLPAAKDNITVSSGYLEGQYSTNQLSVFVMDLLRAGTRLEEYFDASTNAGFLRGLSRILNIWVHGAVMVDLHETGHGMRAKACGSDYALHEKSEDKDPNEPFQKEENFFKYFVKKIPSGPFGGGECAYDKQTLTDEENIILSAGGLNNETYFAEKLADEFHKKDVIGGFVDASAYMADRIHPIIYSTREKEHKYLEDTQVGDDPINMQGHYKKLGINAKKSNMTSAGLISMFLSGTTYSVLKGMYLFWSNPGQTLYRVEPFRVWNFRVPDIFPYWTCYGISYKLVSGYKVGEGLELLFGGEHVLHGKSVTEFSLGVDKKFGESLRNISCRVVTTFGKGFNLEGSCEVPIIECFSVNFGVGTYSCRSLLGQRHAKNMKDGKGRSTSAFISVSFKY